MNPTFTDQVKAVMQYSREEAARLGHDYIGTEHLLLGIIKDGQGKAVKILTCLGLNLNQIKQSIEDYVATSGGRSKLSPDIPFAPRAKQILEMAAEEAKALQSEFVDVEHLLLALLKDREGVAGQILGAYGVDYKIAQAELTEPGSGIKSKSSKREQKAFILYYYPVTDAKKKIIEKTNLEELNRLLSAGWRISGKEEMSGRGAEGYYVSLLLLSR
jgi:ATP-dependent Clp protease ATP-binding subunit ClpC